MRGSAVEVIKGPVTGLPIPANAEIVIEGFVEPDKMRVEGPFGEWTGYYATGAAQEPVLDIKAIYHRHEPILLGCVPERPPDEICRYRAIVRSALLRENITKAGVPAVTAAWAHEVGNARLLLRSRSTNAIRAMPSRPDISPRCAMSAPIRPLHHRRRRRHRCVGYECGDVGAAHAL